MRSPSDSASKTGSRTFWIGLGGTTVTNRYMIQSSRRANFFFFDLSVHADSPRSGGCCCGQRALGWVKLAWPVGEKSVVKITTKLDSETRSSSYGTALLTSGSRSDPTGPWRGLQAWFSLEPNEVLPPETFQAKNSSSSLSQRCCAHRTLPRRLY